MAIFMRSKPVSQAHLHAKLPEKSAGAAVCVKVIHPTFGVVALGTMAKRDVKYHRDLWEKHGGIVKSERIN